MSPNFIQRDRSNTIQCRKIVCCHLGLNFLKCPKSRCAPSIVVFTDGGHIHAIFIVGDGITTELVGKNKSICGALAVLISLYYIFDLAYHRPYAMFMALLQHFVAQEPFK